jgi:L-amino acid N-acyltransferase YncA
MPLKVHNLTAEVMINLKPEYTGKGMGKIAPGYVEAHARRSDIRVLIRIITGKNYPRMRLFESMGYMPCTHHRNIGEISGQLIDVVFYQKEL